MLLTIHFFDRTMQLVKTSGVSYMGVTIKSLITCLRLDMQLNIKTSWHKKRLLKHFKFTKAFQLPSI
jgi:hypothetical protein